MRTESLTDIVDKHITAKGAAMAAAILSKNSEDIIRCGDDLADAYKDAVSTWLGEPCWIPEFSRVVRDPVMKGLAASAASSEERAAANDWLAKCSMHCAARTAGLTPSVESVFPEGKLGIDVLNSIRHWTRRECAGVTRRREQIAAALGTGVMSVAGGNSLADRLMLRVKDMKLAMQERSIAAGTIPKAVIGRATVRYLENAIENRASEVDDAQVEAAFVAAAGLAPKDEKSRWAIATVRDHLERANGLGALYAHFGI